MTPIEFYFDFASPYGFLAAMQIDRIERPVIWRPSFLAPSTRSSASRQARLVRENEGAIAEGVFGSPFFIVDGEPFWGSDRIPLILQVNPQAFGYRLA